MGAFAYWVYFVTSLSKCSFLTELPHLQNITLYETALSDAALPILSAFPALKFVSLWNTNLSPASLNTFKIQNPKIEVVGH